MATNITTTDGIVGWQTGPSNRGTMSLIWSCLTTIFTCTWTVLHLNVPGRRDSVWQRFWRKTKWMAITVLFPEFIFSKAVCDLRLALHELREFDIDLRARRDNPMLYDAPLARASDGGNWKCEWKIEYPNHAKWLYRLLLLQLPPETNEETISSDTGTGKENTKQDYPGDETEQEQEETTHRQPSSAFGSKGNLEARERTCGSSGNVMELRPLEEGEKLSGQANRSQRPYKRSTSPSIRITQEWTVVHSLFAQMGGLSYQRKSVMDDTQPYYALTASNLTPRYEWYDSKHPLDNLVLGKEDIEDKSKADWLVRSVAIAQITWLILDVSLRGSRGLPITQLETATIAFAVMAIFTYVASWWKPKDISKPVILLYAYEGATRNPGGSDKALNLTQPFMLRFQSPAKAAWRVDFITAVERVPNDWVWMEGQTPSLFGLLAISSLVFGGLHCIAWNFEFPTRIELLCWRVASLIATVLPGLTLGASLILGYFRTEYIKRRRADMLFDKLEKLEALALPVQVWEHLTKPKFMDWDMDTISALMMMMPKDPDLDWEKAPSKEILNRQENSDRRAKELSAFSLFISQLRQFYDTWQRRHDDKTASARQELFSSCSYMAMRFNRFRTQDRLNVFWRGYEGFVARKLAISSGTSNVEAIIEAFTEVERSTKPLERNLDRAGNILNFLHVGSCILYVASRLMIIALLFSCLRATPSEAYQVVSWINYLPNIS